VTRRIFTGGQVFDGTGSPATKADVVVEDGRVVEVGLGLDGDEAVDCSGATVFPGFFDCHVHVMMSGVDVLRQLQTPFSYPFYEAVHNLRRTLVQGITHVRDAGGADLGVAEAVRNGLIAGPRMQISISMISQTGGHGDGWHVCGAEVPHLQPHPGRPRTIVDGPDEMRHKVRELLRDGADVIKVATSGGVLSARDDPQHPHFRPAELDVLVEEAEAAGVAVMAHAQSTEGIKAAVRAGIRSIEHGIFLDEEAIDLMLERGTWLVPTITSGDTTEELANDEKLAPEIRAKFAGLGRPEFDARKLAAQAGLKVALGTDAAVFPHGWNLNELTHMANNGFTPEQALHAGTLSAAELRGWEDKLGSLEPGKIADVVVVDGDPFAFETLKDRIEQVWKDGVRVV
jgi:imidazolonepropionase-like amidohydrolase